jgi:hypothetical protein
LPRARTCPVDVDPQLDAERRRARPHQLPGPLVRGELVPLLAGPVEGQQRRGLGQAVQLQELPAELGLDPLDRPRRRRRAGDHDPDAVAARHLVPLGGGVEHHRDDRGGAAQQRDAVVTHPPQDLVPVDLAEHDLRDPHRGERERHAPAVDVEQRQRVQVDVAVADAGVPPEGRRVEPERPVGELHPLRSRGGARGVVDGGGGGLVALPGLRVLVRSPDALVVAPNTNRCSTSRSATTSVSSGSTSSTRAPACSTM